MVFVDADTGKVVNRYSMIHDALDRELYEVSPDTEPVWEEGDAFPGTLNEDQQNLVPRPARPTGCSGTPSAATPTTAPARR